MTHHCLPRRRPFRLGLLASALPALMVTGCASLAPAPAPVAVAAPAAQWQAPLPGANAATPAATPATTPATTSAGAAASLPPTDRSAELKRWWLQFNDTPLAQLIDAAQAASPSVLAARSRIEQARAARVAGGAALGPTVDARAGLSRSRADLSTPILTSATVGLQAAWELDLFGGNAAGRDAAQARLEGAQAGWHDARISVAAETGSAYLVLRACEAQLAQTTLDAASRAEISRLTGLATQAGFLAPANAALARASAAQGNASLTQQRAQCDLDVKALVALTALPEPALRELLRAGAQRLPEPAQLSVPQVPAAALAQRPDLFIAERELAAAGADLTQARAQRYPRIALAGSITPTRLDIGGVSASGTVWSVGPVTVTLPIFDGGVRRANAHAAQARLDAAASNYAGSLRTAVREVEEALVGLQSTAARGEDAAIAADGFERSYRAVEARYKGGLASLFELEDARRSAVAAQSALIDLQRERVAAWIALYRALGGGWDATDAVADASATPRG